MHELVGKIIQLVIRTFIVDIYKREYKWIVKFIMKEGL